MTGRLPRWSGCKPDSQDVYVVENVVRFSKKDVFWHGSKNLQTNNCHHNKFALIHVSTHFYQLKVENCYSTVKGFKNDSYIVYNKHLIFLFYFFFKKSVSCIKLSLVV